MLRKVWSTRSHCYISLDFCLISQVSATLGELAVPIAVPTTLFALLLATAVLAFLFRRPLKVNHFPLLPNTRKTFYLDNDISIHFGYCVCSFKRSFFSHKHLQICIKILKNMKLLTLKKMKNIHNGL